MIEWRGRSSTRETTTLLELRGDNSKFHLSQENGANVDKGTRMLGIAGYEHWADLFIRFLIGRDHKTCHHSFEGGLKPGSWDAGDHKTWVPF